MRIFPLQRVLSSEGMFTLSDIFENVGPKKNVTENIISDRKEESENRP